MLYAIVAVLALILDQAVKYWTTANIVLNTGEKAFLPGILRLTNVHNDGAAFSILEGARWFFVVLCVVFVAAVTYMLVKNIIKSAPARWTAVLVMADSPPTGPMTTLLSSMEDAITSTGLICTTSSSIFLYSFFMKGTSQSVLMS